MHTYHTEHVHVKDVKASKVTLTGSVCVCLCVCAGGALKAFVLNLRKPKSVRETERKWNRSCRMQREKGAELGD